MNIRSWLAAGLLAALAGQPTRTYRIATIEFFGGKGIDISALRASLPVREGDEYSDRTGPLLRQAVTAATGNSPTDVNVTCCDDQQRLLIYIGLTGASSRPFTYNAEPTGTSRLPPSIAALEARLETAIEAAVRKGGEAVKEDDARGYALVNDPAARALQLAVRRYALQHQLELSRALESSDVEQRRVASEVLGYARQSQQQILALVKACRDPDDEVRNNAARAIAVLARSNASVARGIPPATFVEMLSAGVWTDRNKGAMVVERLTATRNPELLANLRATALDALIEMAEWRETSHAYTARMIVGRVAGIPEARLEQLAAKGPVSAITEPLRVR